MNRRNFLKLIAASAVAVAVPLPVMAAGAPAIGIHELMRLRRIAAYERAARDMEEKFFEVAVLSPTERVKYRKRRGLSKEKFFRLERNSNEQT